MKIRSIPFIIFVCLATVNAYANHQVQNISISTSKNVPISIQLNNSITGGGGNFSVTLPTALNVTTQGSAVISGLTIDFTPALDITGPVVFQYSVQDLDEVVQDIVTAQITVTVNDADSGPISNIPVEDTPQQSIGATMDVLCPGLGGLEQAVLTPEEIQLLERCNELTVAVAQGSNAEVLAALQQLAPEEVAVQIRTGQNIADRHSGNIGGRLNALRRGVSGISTSGFALYYDREQLPFSVFEPWLNASRQNRNVSPWGLFISGIVGNVQRDATAQENGFEFQTLGTTIGSDYRVNNRFVIGAAFGFATSDVDIVTGNSAMEVTGINFSNYATLYLSKRSYLDWVFTYSGQNFKNSRNISLFNATAESETKGGLLGLSISGSHELLSKGGWAFTVKGEVDVAKSNIDAYRESGAGALNLSIESQEFSSLVTDLGMELTYAISTGSSVFIPQFNMNWSHQFEGDSVQVRGQFVNDRFGTTFQFETDNPDRDYFQIGLGLSAIFPRGNTLFIQAISLLDRDNYSDFHIALGSRLEF